MIRRVLVIMHDFSLAGPAEIVRARQKDDYYADRLHKLWLDVLLKSAGTKLWLKLRSIPVGHFMYGAATTLCGLQTLGEEYTGIVQVNPSRTAVPEFLNRLVMLVLDSFGSILLISLLNRLARFVQNDSNILPEAKPGVLEAIRLVKAVLPWVSSCHKALFYCGSPYYQVSKRLTGIQYVLVRRWLKDYQSFRGFKLLGVLTTLHLVGLAGHLTWRWWSSPTPPPPTPRETPQGTAGRKCPLCLEDRQRVSATPCGHLFCWACIQEWLQTQSQCPLCRERVTPSRVVPLQNYL